MAEDSEVLGVESVDSDSEKFTLKVKGLPIELVLSRNRQPRTFRLLMDAMRDRQKLDHSIIFEEINEQEAKV